LLGQRNAISPHHSLLRATIAQNGRIAVCKEATAVPKTRFGRKRRKKHAFPRCSRIGNDLKPASLREMPVTGAARAVTNDGKHQARDNDSERVAAEHWPVVNSPVGDRLVLWSADARLCEVVAVMAKRLRDQFPTIDKVVADGLARGLLTEARQVSFVSMSPRTCRRKGVE
jgi:hypothetical protein